MFPPVVICFVPVVDEKFRTCEAADNVVGVAEKVAAPLNVLAPAKVCVPVVTIPLALPDADGIAANDTALIPTPVNEPVGPAVVPPVHPKAVGYQFVLSK